MIVHPEDTVRFTNSMAISDFNNGDNSPGRYGAFSQAKISKTAICTRPAIIAVAILIIISAALLIAVIRLAASNHEKSAQLDKYKQGSVTATSQPAIATASADSTTTPTESKPVHTKPSRLPNTFRPLNYTLTLKSFIPGPDLRIPTDQQFRTEGNLSIIIECNQNSDSLILNSAGINITKGTVRIAEIQGNEAGVAPQAPKSGEIALIKRNGIVYSGQDETVTFHFDRTLLKGKIYRLTFEYVSVVGSKQRGYYRSSFTDPSGKKRWLAVTQFEVADARRALPCFDEPSFKAVFTVTLIHPKGFIAIGNGREKYKDKDIGDGWLETALEPSPKMSSYLLAFCVAPFQSVDTKTRNGIQFRAWSRPEMTKYLQYAANAGPKVMEFYENYFGIPFPLHKMDQVALPDFTAGAMENWGMITYRESTAIYHKDLNTLSDREWTATVIAHEMSHQWFGNLVTMKWWDDLWLNEGFATYMENMGADHIDDGKLHLNDQFVTTIHNAMDLDQLKTTHPLSVPVPTIADADQMFDSISYSKGATVLRMLNFTIGEKLFRNGVKHYLEKMSYQNADHDDLWNAFSYAVAQGGGIKSWSGKKNLDIKEFMDRWTLQAGFPVVKVTRDYSSGSGDMIRFTVKQDRFTLNTTLSGNFSTHGFNYKWHIPIWFKSEGNSATSMKWLAADQREQQIEATSKANANDKWLLVNPELRGYYRVNYDGRNWDLLHKAIINDLTVFDVRSRSMLLEDLFNFALTGHVNYSTVFKFVEYLPKEKNYIPWRSAIYPFSQIKRLLLNHRKYEVLRNFLRKLYGGKFNAFGWSASGLNLEDVLDMKLFQVIVGQACDVDVEECVSDAKKEFQKFKASCDPKASQCNNTISTELRDAVYCTAVRHGNEATWNYFLTRYKHESTQAEKSRYLKALSCTREVWLWNRLQNLAMSAAEMRVNDGVTALRSISYRPGGSNVLFDFIVKQWNAVKERFFISSSIFKRLLKSATRSFNSEVDLQKLKGLARKDPEFIRTHKTVFSTIVSEVQVNVNWMQDYGNDIIEAIQQINI